MLRKILTVVLAIIALILLVAIFLPKKMEYEKSIVINAPIEKVWQQTNSLEAMDAWSPWHKKDPNIKRERSGQNGTVGSTSCWDSQVKEVGAGCQTITKLTPPYRIDTDLAFTRPRADTGKGFVVLKSEGSGTKVTWGFEGKMPYPMNIMLPMMNMEKMMGEDFSNGLNDLKQMAER